MRAMLRTSTIALCIAVSARGQASGFTPMSTDRVHEVGRRIASAYSLTGTEADFTETRLSANGLVRWTGHAVFSKVGFVLDYTTPAGRRVVSDLAATRVFDRTPQGKMIMTESRASQSAYFGLSVMTGAVSPSFASGTEDVGHGAAFLIDDRHVSYFVSTASGLIGWVNVTHAPDVHFTNIRALAAPLAIAKVSAALAP
jgi:hypothetical protein